VRHATQDDLDRVEPLLAALRELPELRERKPGSFSLASRAFLHFHADESDMYVDVRLGATFRRLKVTTRDDQADLLMQVRTALQPHS
jgi:hypothetical protein